jgi:RNA polymerase sigma-B factor
VQDEQVAGDSRGSQVSGSEPDEPRPAAESAESGPAAESEEPRRAAEAMLADLAALPPDSDAHARLRAEIIESLVPLSTHLAARFRNRGEPFDDLVQVANLALVKAVDGFDPERGANFTSYAVPFIVGEIKRHFRDRTWHVRVPRRLQELSLLINREADELTQRLGRAPTVTDLADHLDVGEEEIIEAMEAAEAYHSLSLDAPAGGEPGASSLHDIIPDEHDNLTEVDARVALPPLLAALPVREQRILAMRFFGNLTQSQIAAELGISQMHVSRLISRALATLRRQLLEE